jgi:putative component of membrane protein insertase Oxa1/YidC/SpoIIIJ protein YidD
MKFLLAAMIWVYQRLAPRALRQRCIFRESCSSFVKRVALEDGFRAGIKAFAMRVRCCRPGYHRLPVSPLYPEIREPVRLRDGMIVELATLSPQVQAELTEASVAEVPER